MDVQMDRDDAAAIGKFRPSRSVPIVGKWDDLWRFAFDRWIAKLDEERAKERVGAIADFHGVFWAMDPGKGDKMFAHDPGNVHG